MNAIVKAADQKTLPGMPEPAAPSMFELIMRAVKDPACDPTKMAQLLELSRQVRADDAKAAYNASMIAAQDEMDPVRTDANNPQTRSRYATHAALDRAIRPIYSKHGFALSFDTGEGAPPDHMRVLVYVMHRDGHEKTHHMDMPADGKGAKGGDVMTKTHAAGSAFSYGKRYLEGGVFNIIISDRPEDDGNAAGSGDKITDEQAERILELLTKDKADVPGFCKYMGIASIIELPASQYNRALEVINTRSQKVKAKQ